MTDQKRDAVIDLPPDQDRLVPDSVHERPGRDHRESESRAFDSAVHFVREHWARICILSAMLLIPCFWHRHIEAGDLGSHTYNAWLAELIERGQAPGLWIAHQWTNIVFDLLLVRAASVFGLFAAEKIAVCIAVLVFFWGTFAFVAAMARRAPWILVPCLMVFAYGWTFQMGFFNYYISLGLAFWGLALVEGVSGWELAAVLPVMFLTWLAHPLGAVLLAGGSAYLAAARLLPRERKVWLPAIAGIIIFIGSLYVSAHYKTLWTSALSDWNARKLFGAEQLVLYGNRYAWLANLFLAFILVCLAWDLVSLRKTPGAYKKIYNLPLQIFGLTILSIYLFPSKIELSIYAAPVSLLTERLTSIAAILGCCVLGAMSPKRWHVAGFSALAAVFFFFLFQDTGRVNRMEAQAERLERSLPRGQRVIATIWPLIGSRVLIQHIVDRSCIGHCFSYGNYEPSSGQFRVRANPRNGIVTASAESADAMGYGDYVVQGEDLAVFQIYQCNLSMTDLCIRPLAAGEKNGRIGLHLISEQ